MTLSPGVISVLVIALKDIMMVIIEGAKVIMMVIVKVYTVINHYLCPATPGARMSISGMAGKNKRVSSA
jgi:hypothetical protein